MILLEVLFGREISDVKMGKYTFVSDIKPSANFSEKFRVLVLN